MADDNDRAAALRNAIRVKKAAARQPSLELPRRPADSVPLLGDMQRSLWLIHRLDPSSPAYNLSAGYRVDGSLDLPGLERSFNVVLARHRLLRSTFELEGEQVVQVVHPHRPLAVEVVEADEGGVHAAAVASARRPFDLERGPLIRMHLIREGSDGDQMLLLVLHHILADERSLAIVWQELAEAAAGRLSADHDMPQYDDYAEWLRRRDPAEAEAAFEFWKSCLDPLPDPLRLPFERSAKATARPAGRLLVRRTAGTAPENLRRLAAATGTTPFAVAALAYRILLARLTGDRRIAFATPASTRSHPAAASMIGYFTNPIVVVAEIDERRPVAEAVRRFHDQLRQLLSHASVPFPVLAERLSPPRQRDRHPIFQTMFVYQENSPAPDLGAARLEPVTLDLGASKFDLTLFLREESDALEIALEYRSDRFDEVWMEQLLGHYETLLDGLAVDLERPLAEVPIIDRDEEARLRALSGGPEIDAAAIKLLPDQILDQARSVPESEAVVGGRDRLTYAELELSALAVARELAEAGVQPGDRIGLFLERSAQLVPAILGCHWAGAAYVPLDPAYPERRNLQVIEDAEVAAVLTSAASADRLPSGSWAVIDIEQIDRGRSAALQPRACDPQTPAYLLYTSGSSGRPKGVVVTHANLRASTAARLEFYEAAPGRFLLLPSIAFDSSVAGIFWALATAGTLVIPTDEEARDPRRLATLAARERVTSLLCVPSLYRQLLAFGGVELKGLETAIVAGEACPSRLVEEHFKQLGSARLYNEYGPTEATVWATAHEITATDGEGPVAVGRPIPGVRVELVDAFGRLVPAGVPGEARIAGPTVATGYWRRPDRSEDLFDQPDGPGGVRRYHTGDLMAWTAEGRLLFLGRSDDQIKIRGFRIEPGEVEQALLDEPGVTRAAVVAHPHSVSSLADNDPQNAQLVAFVETEGACVPEGWRDRLRQRLPLHAIPSRLVVLETLPRLPNGKIDRRRLQEIEVESEPPSAEPTACATSAEHSVVSLWEGLLGITEIGLDDNFFELGGHSLLVVEMAVAIERDFGVALEAAEVFEHPTVRAIARRIEQREVPGTEPYRHLYPIQPSGSSPPLVFAIPHFFTSMVADRFRGERPVYGLRGVGMRAEGNLGRWRTMEALGEELVAEIARRFPEDEVIVAGYSFGATMAFETVRVMEARAIPVQGLYLIAPMALDFFRFGPLRLQLDELRQPVAELSKGEAIHRYLRTNHPLTRRLYQRIWRWWVIEPWRRLLCTVGRVRRMAGLPLTQGIRWADVRVDRFRLHASYRPRPITTSTVIFNPIEPTTDAAATWRPYFDGPLSVVDIPDPHLGEAEAEQARHIILDRLRDLERESAKGAHREA